MISVPGRARQKNAECQEAEELAAKCYLLLDFYEERFGSPEYSRLASIGRNGIAQALAQCHVPALKMAYRDLREEMEDLSPGDQAEIKHRLQATFESDLGVEVQRELLRAQEIVGKGKISNRDEYALLRTYLDHHTDRWGTATFIARATEMLTEYERAM